MTDTRLSDMMAAAVANVSVDPNLAQHALSGGKRRRRRRRIAAGLAAASVIGAVAVTSAVVTGTTASDPARLIPAGPSQSASPAPSATCPASLPASWTSRLQAGKIPLPPSMSALPLAISPDGMKVYAAVREPGWSGVAAISRDGTVQRIQAYPSDDAEANWGAASDHDLVWVQSNSPNDLSSKMFTWNATTGRVDVLNPLPAPGTPVARSQSLPVIQGDQVTWVDAIDGDNNRVHLYDLATGVDRVVFTGNAKASTLAGSWLVWIGGEAGQGTKLHLIDAASGAALPTPAPLVSVTDVAAVTGSYGSLTWTATDNTVHTWKTGEAKPREIFEAASGDFADYPMAGGSYVVWNASSSAYIANVDSGGVATLSATPVTQGSLLVLTTETANTGKVAHPIRSVSIVDTALLPDLPRCKIR